MLMLLTLKGRNPRVTSGVHSGEGSESSDKQSTYALVMTRLRHMLQHWLDRRLGSGERGDPELSGGGIRAQARIRRACMSAECERPRASAAKCNSISSSDSLSYVKHVKVADRPVRGAVHMLVCKPANQLSRVAVRTNGPAGSPAASWSRWRMAL